MPSKPLLERPELAPAVRHFTAACAASRAWDRKLTEALALYGGHGVQISGCGREHFPSRTKDHLRTLSRAITDHCNAARNARPSGVHTSTMHELGCAVATRDGSGFYGPQA